MIQDADLVKKMILQVDIFQHHYSKKEYVEAKLIREKTGIIAVFVETQEPLVNELFGTRQTEEPVEGLFDEEKCIKAGFESIKRGFDMQRMTYADVMRQIEMKRG